MANKGKWLSKVKSCLSCSGGDSSNESGKRTGTRRGNGRKKPKNGDTNSLVSIFKKPTSSIEEIFQDAETQQGSTYRPPSPPGQKESVLLQETGSSETSTYCSVSPRVASPRATTTRIHSPKATSPSDYSLSNVIPRTSSRVLSPEADSLGVGYVSPGSPTVPSPISVSPRASYVRPASPTVAPTGDVSPTPTRRPPSSRRSFSKSASYKVTHKQESVGQIDPIFPYHHVAATKIQAAYRGYTSRMGTGSARGLVRLQRFVRGQCVRHQTANSMKQMQRVVRIKTRILSQTLQMLDQEKPISHKQATSVTAQSDASDNRDWDGSVLSKEEKEARNKRKEDAVINKERAMVILQSHQILESADGALMNLQNDEPVWSWNWSERNLLKANQPGHQSKKKVSLTDSKSSTPVSSIARRGNQYSTPQNSQSRIPNRFSQLQTPDQTPRSHYSSRSLLTKYSKPAPRGSQSPSAMNFTDTESLRSYSACSVPRYMSPTVSARAKMRHSGNFNDSASIESNRRFSYPLTPRSRTSRGTLFPDNDAGSQRSVGTNQSSRSITFPDGRKPFNRFV